MESIRKQGLSEYEILVYGAGNVDKGIRSFYREEWTGTVDINKMRNLLCRHATKDFIVLMDVDVELAGDWYARMQTADCFDVIGSRLVRTDNNGIRDWVDGLRPLKNHKFRSPLTVSMGFLPATQWL
ncbi:MAG: hypothetical protein ACK4WF_09640, partial [Candidatus Brocadiales bacterium]